MTVSSASDSDHAGGGVESGYAWVRLVISLLVITIGSSIMYVVVVAMPTIQLVFGVTRGGGSLPFVAVMIGFGVGGVVMGRIADRYGCALTVAIGSVCVAAGYILAGLAPTFETFVFHHGVLLGFFGCASMFTPVIADISKWFRRNRGIAIAICACGNYLAGVIWPPVVHALIERHGWQQAYVGFGVFTMVAMVPLILALARPAPAEEAVAFEATAAPHASSLGLSPGMLVVLLSMAGVGCCVAMAMPQVHLVPLCADLGFGPARGAQMLSLMLACGIVSRVVFGWIADQIGGLRTILFGASLQGIALVLFLPVQGLVALYLVSALFGLFQGGIVPCYAIIVREYFPASEAGRWLGVIILASTLGMALGGWLSGVIYDWTGSYTVAFVNAIGWNLLNISVIVFLLSRVTPQLARDLAVSYEHEL